MAQTKLVKKVETAIEIYFKEISKTPLVFSNELHLQMHLAQFLEKSGCKLKYEYHVPGDQLKGDYPWLKPNSINRSDVYLDIVVYDKNEYLPIEIKYKTRSMKTNTHVFGDPEKVVGLLRDQGAQDLSMYGFWKDVYRLELVRDTYPSVKNGIALFVTNDPYYQTNNPNSSVNHFAFRMTDGIIVKGDMRWSKKCSKIAAGHSGFKLTGEYPIQWVSIGQHSTPRKRGDFCYCMVII